MNAAVKTTTLEQVSPQQNNQKPYHFQSKPRMSDLLRKWQQETDHHYQNIDLGLNIRFNHTGNNTETNNDTQTTSTTEPKPTPSNNSPKSTAVFPLIGNTEINQALITLLQSRSIPHYNGRETNIPLRNFTMFYFNINLGLRCSDLLNLQINNIINPDGSIKDSLTIKEQKNKKPKELFLRDNLKQVLSNYLSSLGNYHPDWYLFHGMSSSASHYEYNPFKPMKYNTALDIIKKVKATLPSDFKIATHTMRKTYARNRYDELITAGNDCSIALEMLSEELNHSSVAVTRKYIGLQRERVKEDVLNMTLGDSALELIGLGTDTTNDI